jgi:ankyrin repeat protein
MTLIEAAKSGNLGEARQLIANDTIVSPQDNEVLCWAADHNRREIVKCLLENSVDVTAEDNYALRMAAKNGHLNVVKLGIL